MRRQILALAIAVILASTGGTAWGAPYTLTRLGQLPAIPNSMAYSINDSGQITGFAEDFGAGIPHAFLWQASTGLQDLNAQIGENTSFARGINNSGQVVGSAAGSNNHPFLWQNGTTQFLTWSINSNANAINDLGQVAGTNNATSDACIWQNGNIQKIGNGVAWAINNNGQVAGESGQHAFFWQSSSGMQQIDSGSNWGSSYGRGINDAGQVVGEGIYSSGGGFHAFLWQSGSGMQDLDPSATWGSSRATDINNSGQVVGWTWNGSQFAIVWQSGAGIQNLNNMIDPSPGFTLTCAAAINNKGQIVGYGTDSTGQHEAFLLTPTTTAVPGDANKDGKVDVTDLNRVLTNYNKSGMAWSDGDFDANGSVDVIDLNKVLTSYDKTFAASAAAVPEPASLTLLAAGLVALLALTRQKR